MQESFAALRSEALAEASFGELESSAQRLHGATKALATEGRKLLAAATMGNMLVLRKALQAVDRRFADLTAAAKSVSSVDIDTLASSIGGQKFLSEILAAASHIGLTDLRISRNAILSYPQRVAFESSTSYRLGSHTMTAMRPSIIANVLKEERDKISSVVPGYLETVRTAYLLLSKGQFGISVALSDVYDLLTILPGSRKHYSEGDFIRDIGLLDERGPSTAKDGSRVSFPASTSARMNRGYAAVNSRGEEVPYASIRFDLSKSP
jgi:hypothetical protein